MVGHRLIVLLCLGVGSGDRRQDPLGISNVCHAFLVLLLLASQLILECIRLKPPQFSIEHLEHITFSKEHPNANRQINNCIRLHKQRMYLLRREIHLFSVHLGRYNYRPCGY